MQNDTELSKKYHSLTNEQKIEFVQSLSVPAFNHFRYYSDCFLRPSQIVPEGDWRYFIAQCGRGWGKSKMGAHWLASKVYQGVKGLALVAPTHSDIEDYIKEALEAEFPPNKKPRYIAGDKKKFICFNGIEIKAYSSDKEIRGGNLSYIWLDEFCAWCDRNEEKATERFKVLNFAVRKSKAQFVITTTPRNWKVLNDWNKRFKADDPAVKFVYGSMEENYALTQQAKDELYKEYSGTRIGRQELAGEILTDSGSAYWTREVIDSCIKPLPSLFTHPPRPQFLNNAQLMGKEIIPPPQDPTKPYLIRSGCGFDPAVSKGGDECGIITASLYSDNCVYVQRDDSNNYSPDEWSKKINQLYCDLNLSFVVLEKNQGGNTLSYILRSVNAYMKIIEIHASQGKMTRAEHTSALYAQGKVFHIQHFDKLEEQMCSFDVNYSKSPDRLDALNLIVTELLFPTPNTAMVGPRSFNLPSL